MKKSDRFLGLSFGQVGVLICMFMLIVAFAFLLFSQTERIKLLPKPEPAINISMVYGNQVTKIDSVNSVKYNGNNLFFTNKNGDEFVWAGDYLIQYVK